MKITLFSVAVPTVRDREICQYPFCMNIAPLLRAYAHLLSPQRIYGSEGLDLDSIAGRRGIAAAEYL